MEVEAARFSTASFAKTYVPGSAQFKPIGTYNVDKMKGTWGLIKTTLTTPVKQRDAGYYVVQKGMSSMAYNTQGWRNRKKIDTRQLPRGGSVMRVVESFSDNSMPTPPMEPQLVDANPKSRFAPAGIEVNKPEMIEPLKSLYPAIPFTSPMGDKPDKDENEMKPPDAELQDQSAAQLASASSTSSSDSSMFSAQSGEPSPPGDDSQSGAAIQSDAQDSFPQLIQIIGSETQMVDQIYSQIVRAGLLPSISSLISNPSIQQFQMLTQNLSSALRSGVLRLGMSSANVVSSNMPSSSAVRNAVVQRMPSRASVGNAIMQVSGRIAQGVAALIGGFGNVANFGATIIKYLIDSGALSSVGEAGVKLFAVTVVLIYGVITGTISLTASVADMTANYAYSSLRALAARQRNSVGQTNQPPQMSFVGQNSLADEPMYVQQTLPAQQSSSYRRRSEDRLWNPKLRGTPGYEQYIVKKRMGEDMKMSLAYKKIRRRSS